MLLVAQLQDCVKALCNECAQASEPRKDISHRRGRHRGRKRIERVGARAEKKRRKEPGDKGEDRLVRKKRKGGRGCFLLGPAMFPIM